MIRTVVVVAALFGCSCVMPASTSEDLPTPPPGAEVVVGHFARWCGKVNLHSTSAETWAADDDCTSGCNIGGLSYCQKLWPRTVGIRRVEVSFKAAETWRTAGCGPVVEQYDGDDEFECLARSDLR